MTLPFSRFWYGVLLVIIPVSYGCHCQEDASDQGAASEVRTPDRPGPAPAVAPQVVTTTPPQAQPSTVAGSEPPSGYPMRTDEALAALIAEGQRSATAENKRVLLVFGADWCTDCRAVSAVMRSDEVQSVLRDRYEAISVNLGRFDRHSDLIQRYGIERIATLVVIDGAGNVVARSTLEPISNRQPLVPAQLARWLRSPPEDA